MLKRNKQKSIYDKALEKKQEKLEKEKLYKNLDLNQEKNTIVFERKNNTLIKILNLLKELIEKIIKFIFFIVVFILLTVGATVLFNPSLRQDLLEIINNINILT